MTQRIQQAPPSSTIATPGSAGRSETPPRPPAAAQGSSLPTPLGGLGRQFDSVERQRNRLIEEAQRRFDEGGELDPAQVALLSAGLANLDRIDDLLRGSATAVLDGWKRAADDFSRGIS